MHRVTMKQVAMEAGLSVSCAARALKGRPDISTETCARVQQVATRLGYHADPMLSALAAYRRTQRQPGFQGTLAFLATYGDESEWVRIPEVRDLLLGARQRAETLGYRLETFRVDADRSSQRRLWRTLYSRGVRGGVLRSFPTPLEDIHLPFDKFPCVDLFSEPHFEKLSTVSSYHAQSMEVALKETRRRGYRHPALVLDEGLSRLLHHGWEMTFRVLSKDFERASHHLYGKLDWAEFRRWARREKVDVLIFCGSETQVQNLEDWTSVGAKPALVCMDLFERNCGVAGIYQDRLRGGATAVEWLHSMLITAQLGAAKLPSVTMIPGVWHDGVSLPFRKK